MDEYAYLVLWLSLVVLCGLRKFFNDILGFFEHSSQGKIFHFVFFYGYKSCQTCLHFFVASPLAEDWVNV